MRTTTPQSDAQVQLAFDNVCFSFDGTPALCHVSFELRGGETLVVLGAAGSGKTVLLKLALGLLRPDSGRVILFGQDTSALSEREWYAVRSRIGVLFQEGGLFDSLNIEDNVAYPLRNQPELHVVADEILPRVAQSLEFVELAGTQEQYPSELSGGMRRRAGIARAIVTQPDLLLYDSPTRPRPHHREHDRRADRQGPRRARRHHGLRHPARPGRPDSGGLPLRARIGRSASRGPGEAARHALSRLEGRRSGLFGAPAELAGCNDSYVAKFAPVPFLAS